MRFIGGKSLIFPNIMEMIETYTEGVRSTSDLFSGSGVVTRLFKRAGLSTYSNDLMYFSYVLLRGTTSISLPLKFEGLREIGISDPVRHLNGITDLKADLDDDTKALFMYQHYSPRGGRMYFTESNARKIDLIRLTIERWRDKGYLSDDEYFHLLAILLEAVPFVSNTTGVYGAFLKHWDPRALKPLTLEYLPLEAPLSVNRSTHHIVYNRDSLDIVDSIDVDLAYYDPPYNQRQYLPNYHILETIARYDYPEIKGKTGLRDYTNERSLFCSKSKVYDETKRLIERTHARYIIFSYNSEGLLSHQEIKELLLSYGSERSFKYKVIQYNRYKNASTKHNNNLSERLYFVAKE